MRCLHICNDFSGSQVHQNLYRELDLLNLEQTIFNPFRKYASNKPVNLVFNTLNSKIIYSKPLYRWHKFFFKTKTNYLYRSLNNQINLKSIDLIHATTLCSDGALAYKIFKLHKIPYIVSVRGTDVNYYLKQRWDLRNTIAKIILNASRVIFISDTIKSNFFESIPQRINRESLRGRCLIIYNGVDGFWLKNRKQKKINFTHSILYIGNFSKNKNVSALIDALVRFNLNEKQKLTLHLVGGGGSEEKAIMKMCEIHPQTITFHGKISDKNSLKRVFGHNTILAMPSISETFGLVYIEAISQGLVILGSKHQGIYGVFSAPVGEFVNPKSEKSIYNGIKKCINNYGDYAVDKIELDVFSWKTIADKHLSLYRQALFSDTFQNY